tara:strand:- start:107 stop:868 length:762 start_codon:yes stop_codon:yes gene_type:complete
MKLYTYISLVLLLFLLFFCLTNINKDSKDYFNSNVPDTDLNKIIRKRNQNINNFYNKINKLENIIKSDDNEMLNNMNEIQYNVIHSKPKASRKKLETEDIVIDSKSKTPLLKLKLVDKDKYTDTIHKYSKLNKTDLDLSDIDYNVNNYNRPYTPKKTCISNKPVKYVLKSSIPDMNDYIKKSSIKPCNKVDMSKYILKTELLNKYPISKNYHLPSLNEIMLEKVFHNSKKAASKQKHFNFPTLNQIIKNKSEL